MSNHPQSGSRTSHDEDDGDEHDGHAHTPKNFGPAFAIGVTLNLAFVLIEGVFGILSNSMALVADAGHNLSDVFGLLVAWGASHLVKRNPTPRFTYGLGASSILAALANGVFLLIACGGIIWEAAQRFTHPEPISGTTVMIVAAIGIAVNGFTAWLFLAGSTSDINIRGAFLHMVADAAVSLGVVISGAVIMATGWLWLDPLVSLVIVTVIVWGTWGLLREATTMAMHAVPSNVDALAVRKTLQGLPGVTTIHDLHIWPLSTTQTALTCHLVMPEGRHDDDFIPRIAQVMRDQFKIGHVTIQIERDSTACALEPDEVI